MKCIDCGKQLSDEEIRGAELFAAVQDEATKPEYMCDECSSRETDFRFQPLPGPYMWMSRRSDTIEIFQSPLEVFDRDLDENSESFEPGTLVCILPYKADMERFQWVATAHMLMCAPDMKAILEAVVDGQPIEKVRDQARRILKSMRCSMPGDESEEQAR